MNTEKFKEIIELDRELKELEEVKRKINNNNARLSYIWEYRDGDCRRIIYETLKPIIAEAHEDIKHQVDNRIEEIKQRIKDF